MTERRRHLASTSPIVPIIAPALLLGLASAFSAGCNGGGGSPTSPPPPSPTVSQANVIEALFLGEGPLSPSGAIGCRDTGVWTHFPHGSQVTAKLASSLSARERQVSESFLAEVPGMVFGGISLVVQSTPEADPIPASQEVTAATLPVPQIERICRVGAGGCTQIVFAGFGIARSARTVSKHLFDGAIHAHELGHGVYGLCHVDGTVYPQALMASPQASVVFRFDPLERQAIQAVFRAGLGGGATRADFERLGLINRSGSSAAAPSRTPDPTGIEGIAPRAPRAGRERQREPMIR